MNTLVQRSRLHVVLYMCGLAFVPQVVNTHASVFVCSLSHLCIQDNYVDKSEGVFYSRFQSHWQRAFAQYAYCTYLVSLSVVSLY